MSLRRCALAYVVLRIVTSKTSSSFGVYIKEQDDGTGNGTFRDVRFDFICVSRGRIFCHGSVDGFTGIADVEYN